MGTTNCINHVDRHLVMDIVDIHNFCLIVVLRRLIMIPGFYMNLIYIKILIGRTTKKMLLLRHRDLKIQLMNVSYSYKGIVWDFDTSLTQQQI